MAISVKEIVTGRKTFFITPDTSLIPEAYLEDFFALGYECYFVENDKRVKLEKKVDVILSLFKDVILFFNIDFRVDDIDWQIYIKSLIEKYNNSASIGVMYTRRQKKDEKSKLEQKYLYEMELGCGCIQLEYQKRQNFEIVEKILYANQAQGRRKNIRAICTSSCTYSCSQGQGQKDISGTLQDISLSHFTLVSSTKNFSLKLYDKVEDFHFNIRGFLFRSDAVLIMERDVGLDKLYVFSFISSTGANGLDPRIKQLLTPNIYKLMSLNCKNLLDQLYTRVDENSEASIADLQEI